MRSSGRIPKEIPILLIGSDLDGRVFSENTTTVVLSRNGAGVLSKHKLSPEQELVLRWPEKNKEAEIRVVGHIGTEARSHTYGVAFFDTQVNFWEMDFPAISPLEVEMGLLLVVCSACGASEKIDSSSMEADICATNDGVIRFCKRCGTSTLWKLSDPASTAEQSAPADASQMSLFSAPPPLASSPAPGAAANPAPPAPPAPNYSPEPPPSSAPSHYSPEPPAQPPPPPVVTPSAPSFYASASELPQLVTQTRGLSTAVLTMPGPEKPAPPKVNRRKHPRVKVSYNACVRHPDRGDDIVTCEDMSKGGLRFKSRKHYYIRSLIEVAVPYQQGQPAIFVPAQIVFVQELPEQQLYRYGVQYLKPTQSRDGF